MFFGVSWCKLRRLSMKGNFVLGVFNHPYHQHLFAHGTATWHEIGGMKFATRAGHGRASGHPHSLLLAFGGVAVGAQWLQIGPRIRICRRQPPQKRMQRHKVVNLHLYRGAVSKSTTPCKKDSPLEAVSACMRRTCTRSQTAVSSWPRGQGGGAAVCAAFGLWGACSRGVVQRQGRLYYKRWPSTERAGPRMKVMECPVCRSRFPSTSYAMFLHLQTCVGCTATDQEVGIKTTAVIVASKTTRTITTLSTTTP